MSWIGKVLEELNDAAIVQTIQSDNVADVEQADDFVQMTTTKAQACHLASALHEFVLAQPRLFHVSAVAALNNMCITLNKSMKHSWKHGFDRPVCGLEVILMC
jgi:hypothetical protein